MIFGDSSVRIHQETPSHGVSTHLDENIDAPQMDFPKKSQEKTATEHENKDLQSENKKDPNQKELLEKEKRKEEKAIRHRQKTRRGLLTFLQKNDGKVDLSTLHNHSEMRYLIGHRAFSDLMEEMVDDGVVTFDWEENMAHLTDSGLRELE